MSRMNPTPCSPFAAPLRGAVSDARIPVLIGGPDPGDSATALLVEGEPPTSPGRAVAGFVLARSPHLPGCLCCAPRTPAARALARLFLARARGDAPPFARVLALPQTDAGAAAIRDALAADVLAAARFRLEG